MISWMVFGMVLAIIITNQNKMMSITQLTKEESIVINGGEYDSTRGTIYDAGYAVGKTIADLVDWFEGFIDGFKEGFD